MSLHTACLALLGGSGRLSPVRAMPCGPRPSRGCTTQGLMKDDPLAARCGGESGRWRTAKSVQTSVPGNVGASLCREAPSAHCTVPNEKEKAFYYQIPNHSSLPVRLHHRRYEYVVVLPRQPSSPKAACGATRPLVEPSRAGTLG